MSQHKEFPELTPEAERALREADRHLDPSKPDWRRLYLASFLREAMKQATDHDQGLWDELQAIADNLHSPPPLPPTLAQARKADLDTPEGKAAVRDFLATLVEWVQP